MNKEDDVTVTIEWEPGHEPDPVVSEALKFIIEANLPDSLADADEMITDFLLNGTGAISPPGYTGIVEKLKSRPN